MLKEIPLTSLEKSDLSRGRPARRSLVRERGASPTRSRSPSPPTSATQLARGSTVTASTAPTARATPSSRKGRTSGGHNSGVHHLSANLSPHLPANRIVAIFDPNAATHVSILSFLVGGNNGPVLSGIRGKTRHGALVLTSQSVP